MKGKDERRLSVFKRLDEQIRKKKSSSEFKEKLAQIEDEKKKQKTTAQYWANKKEELDVLRDRIKKAGLWEWVKANPDETKKK